MIEFSTPDALTPEDLIRAIEDDIILGRLAPGSRLAEDALMAQYGASRNLILEALTHLERSGIVRRDRNLSATVASYSAEEVRHIYEIREMLTRQAALMTPLPASPSLIAQLTEIQGRYARATESGNLRDVHQINEEFHAALSAACGNAPLARTLQDYVALTVLMRSATLMKPSGLAKSRREHDMMIELLQGDDPWAFAQLCIEHIQTGKNDYLDRVSGQETDALRNTGT